MNFDMHLTTACNMKCTFCGAWEYGEQAFFISEGTAKECLKTARLKNYTIVTFTGGEPTIHPQFTDLLSYAAQLGFRIVVTTNGLHMTPQILSVCARTNALLRISMHTLNAAKHKQLTGTDSFSTVQDTVSQLQETRVMHGIGCTVTKENVSEIVALAQYAWATGGAFIRYTPVVAVRGASDQAMETEFYIEMLTRIAKICVKNRHLLYLGSAKIPRKASLLLSTIFTRRCAGGSSQHIICDCHERVVACSFIPVEMNLFSDSTGNLDSDIECTRGKMNIFLNSLSPQGKCATCTYKDICKGGCLTTKLSLELSPNAEQPVCIYEITGKILQGFSVDEQVFLMEYWARGYLMRAPVREKEKNCMRHLPIWQISFNPMLSKEDYSFNGDIYENTSHSDRT